MAEGLKRAIAAAKATRPSWRARAEKAEAIIASQSETITKMEHAADERSATVKRLVDERDALIAEIGRWRKLCEDKSAEIDRVTEDRNRMRVERDALRVKR
jgi:chromosome segregation ATPase